MIYFKAAKFDTLKPFVYSELQHISRQEFVSALYLAINFYAEKVKETLGEKSRQLLKKGGAVDFGIYCYLKSEVDRKNKTIFKEVKKNMTEYIQMVAEIYVQIKQIDQRRREADKLTKFYIEHFIKSNEPWIESNSIELHRKIFLKKVYNNQYLKVFL